MNKNKKPPSLSLPWRRPDAKLPACKDFRLIGIPSWPNHHGPQPPHYKLQVVMKAEMQGTCRCEWPSRASKREPSSTKKDQDGRLIRNLSFHTSPSSLALDTPKSDVLARPSRRPLPRGMRSPGPADPEPCRDIHTRIPNSWLSSFPNLRRTTLIPSIDRYQKKKSHLIHRFSISSPHLLT